MLNHLTKSKFIISLGTGGVGKTTVSLGLAWALARKGKKVLVLTVDPSERLVSLLKLTKGADYHKLDVDTKGELWATIVDHEALFLNFLKEFAKNEKELSKIKSNRLFQRLVMDLSASQEFTALEALVKAMNENKFDHIILDTPPAQHAFEFLNAPQKLSALFQEGIAQWFQDPSGDEQPFYKRWAQTGTRQVLKALESLTGKDFFEELADFFKAMDRWREPLQARMAQSHKILTSAQTSFVIVSAVDALKFHHGLKLAKEVRKAGYSVRGLILNRQFPLEKNQIQECSGETKNFLEQVQEFYQSQSKRIQQDLQQQWKELSVAFLKEQTHDLKELKDFELIAMQIEEHLS